MNAVKCNRSLMSDDVICPDGDWFHAEYKWVDEVRGAIAAAGAIPVAVGSGTINRKKRRAMCKDVCDIVITDYKNFANAVGVLLK